MYQALYRKYRPQTFDEVVGQGAVTQTLKAQLRDGRLSHAYLFTGTRGTGKTTCARILAKAVNCRSPQDGNPCNVCDACRSIDAGSCTDVIEIDAASNNGVDQMRALRDEAVYAPAMTARRVYIIDEVHMLSLSAFNALLKILEEPPAHLMFILATTELHKVPATILSRCQRYAFRRLSQEDIAGRLREVAEREALQAEPEALALLARLADGALRDGMSLLDQCASAAGGRLDREKVSRTLGLAGDERIAALMGEIARHDTAAALSTFTELYQGGRDIAAMVDELLTLSRDLLMEKTAPDAAGLRSGICTEEERQPLLSAFSRGELLYLTGLLQKTASGFAQSANRRLDTELCLMQLCDPALTLAPDALNARLSRLEDAAASGVLPAAAPEKAPPQRKKEAPAPSAAEPEKTPPKEPGDTFWTDFIAEVRPRLSVKARGFFAPSGPVSGEVRGDTLALTVESAFVKSILDDAAVQEVLRRCAGEMLGRTVAVRVEVRGAQNKQNESFSELLRYGEAHPDVFEIH